MRQEAEVVLAGCMMNIRPAVAAEAPALSALVMRAKAHWGYSAETLERWRPELAVTPADLRERPTFVAMVGAEVAGFYSLRPSKPSWELDNLWVLPDFMHQGIGRALLSHALETAARGGASEVAVDADPNAASFYLECGAVHRGDVAAPIGGQPERVRPQLAFMQPIEMSALKFREITAADVPALFHVRPRTRENAMTLEELQRLGINPQSVTESLGKSTKGWVCEDSGRVVAFSMADRATAEFLVIAVLPEYEGKGVGGRLMTLAEEWLAASGCKRAWLTTDLDTTLRAYGFYRKRGWTDWKIERRMRWMELSIPR